jgi:hypothetical protein
VFVKTLEFVNEEFSGDILFFEEFGHDFAGIVSGTGVAYYPIIY